MVDYRNVECLVCSNTGERNISLSKKGDRWSSASSVTITVMDDGTLSAIKSGGAGYHVSSSGSADETPHIISKSKAIRHLVNADYIPDGIFCNEIDNIIAHAETVSAKNKKDRDSFKVFPNKEKIYPFSDDFYIAEAEAHPRRNGFTKATRRWLRRHMALRA